MHLFRLSRVQILFEVNGWSSIHDAGCQTLWSYFCTWLFFKRSWERTELNKQVPGTQCLASEAAASVIRMPWCSQLSLQASAGNPPSPVSVSDVSGGGREYGGTGEGRQHNSSGTVLALYWLDTIQPLLATLQPSLPLGCRALSSMAFHLPAPKKKKPQTLVVYIICL